MWFVSIDRLFSIGRCSDYCGRADVRKHHSASISFLQSRSLLHKLQVERRPGYKVVQCSQQPPCPTTTATVATSVTWSYNWFPPLSCRECHIDNHVTERTDLPDHLIVGSQGTDIFTQELTRVNIDHESSQRSFGTFSSKMAVASFF